MLTLITGATQGIGKALALQFAAAGSHLAITARSADELLLLKKYLESRFNIRVHAKASDLSKKANAILWADSVRKNAGTPDVIIHNVGQFIAEPLFHKGGASLEKMINLNLLAAHYITASFREEFINRKSGHIFNIVSHAATHPRTDAPAYSVSKAAFLAWSDMLFAEMRPHGVKVTAILPGPVYTNSWNKIPVDPDQLIQPDEVARMVYEAFRSAGNALTSRIEIRSMYPLLDP